METIRFDYLNTFLTVVRTQSFSIAAKELRISQGTVSHHIAALEAYFGAELFKRSANGVDVTDAGAILKETAEKMLRQASDARVKISQINRVLQGTISIAASTIPEEYILPGLMADFQKKNPAVKFKIKAQDSLSSLSSLQVNDVDFAAVGTKAGFEEKFDFLPIGEDQLVLIVACNHELAQRKSVRLEEVAKYPVVLREETSGTRLELQKLLEAHQVSFEDVALEVGSTSSVITAVSEGRGVSVISSLAAVKAQAAGLVTVVPIVDFSASRQLYMARPKKPMLKPAEAFWEFCKAYRYKPKTVVCPES